MTVTGRRIVNQEILGGMFGRNARQQLADDLDDTRSWVDPNGHTLSDRVWNSKAADRRAIDGVLRAGLVNADSGAGIARRLVQHLAPRPPGAPGGSGLYAARRLARTEMTRAYGQATIEAAKRNPLVGRIKWSLSGSHPKPDDCNDKASRSSRDMPRGVYLADEVPRYPSHPNCLCCLSPYVTQADIDAYIKEFQAKSAPPAPAEPVYTAENPYRAPQFADIPDDKYRKLLEFMGDPTGESFIEKAYQRPAAIPPYRPATTLEEAEEYGKSLGVPYYKVGAKGAEPTTTEAIARHLRAANYTAESLHDLSVRGVNLPSTIQVMEDTGGAVAYYRPIAEQLMVDVKNAAWKGTDAQVEGAFKSAHNRGFLYGETPQDAIVHEVGHFNHIGKDANINDRIGLALNSYDRSTAEGISVYASTEPTEYIAEAFVKKYKTGKLTPREQALYDKLEGPAIP